MAKGKRNTRSRKENDRKKALKKIEMELEEGDSLKNKIIVIIGVLLFIAVFYLLAIHITNKNSSSNTTKEENNVPSDYSEILLGSSFNRSEKEYLVIYYDKDDSETSSTLSTSISDYKAKDDNLTVYTVDMSNMFNKEYVTIDETNKNPSSVDELRINGSTLIKFTDGKVSEYIEGSAEIKDYLG